MLPITAMDKAGVVSVIVDLAKAPSTASEARPLFRVPKGVVVIAGAIEVLSESSAAGTVAVGTTADAAMVAAADLEVEGLAGLAVASALYTVDDVLTATFTAAHSDGRFRVSVALINLSGN